MKKKRIRKQVMLLGMALMIVLSGMKLTETKSYAGKRADPAPGHEYGGSFDLGSTSAKKRTDELVKSRAYERGLTIREYLEQTGQTLPATSSNKSLLDVKPSGGGTTQTQPPKPAHSHSYQEEVTKEPTCKEKGLKTFTCDCGNTYTETIEMTAHEYEEEVTKEPDCQEVGEKTFTCKHCGDSYMEEMKKTDHEPGALLTTKEPGCETQGIREVFCKYCGEALKRQSVEPLGHEPLEEVVEQEPTMLKEGKAVVRCSRCEEALETRTLPSNPAPLYAAVAVMVVLAIAVGVWKARKK